jgi:LysM repeat protein
MKKQWVMGAVLVVLLVSNVVQADELSTPVTDSTETTDQTATPMLLDEPTVNPDTPIMANDTDALILISPLDARTVQKPGVTKNNVYRVKAKDTLYRIAKRNLTTVKSLVKLNPSIKNPNQIFVGQWIRLRN